MKTDFIIEPEIHDFNATEVLVHAMTEGARDAIGGPACVSAIVRKSGMDDFVAFCDRRGLSWEVRS